jgi:hypothetical protein
VNPPKRDLGEPLCQQSPRMNANEIQKSKKKLPFAENHAVSEKMEM